MDGVARHLWAPAPMPSPPPPGLYGGSSTNGGGGGGRSAARGAGGVASAPQPPLPLPVLLPPARVPLSTTTALAAAADSAAAKRRREAAASTSTAPPHDAGRHTDRTPLPLDAADLLPALRSSAAGAHAAPLRLARMTVTCRRDGTLIGCMPVAGLSAAEAAAGSELDTSSWLALATPDGAPLPLATAPAAGLRCYHVIQRLPPQPPPSSSAGVAYFRLGDADVDRALAAVVGAPLCGAGAAAWYTGRTTAAALPLCAPPPLMGASDAAAPPPDARALAASWMGRELTLSITHARPFAAFRDAEFVRWVGGGALLTRLTQPSHTTPITIV